MLYFITSAIAFLLGYVFGTVHRGKFESEDDIMRQFEELEAVRIQQEQVQKDIEEKERIVNEERKVINRIIEKLSKHSNVLAFLLMCIASGVNAQNVIPPTFSYHDVMYLKPGMTINKLDSTVVAIHVDRYNFYEGMVSDAIVLKDSYENIVVQKDSIIRFERDGRIACLHDTYELERKLNATADLQKKNDRLRKMNLVTSGIITAIIGFVIVKRI
jgi:hypothetical protein